MCGRSHSLLLRAAPLNSRWPLLACFDSSGQAQSQSLSCSSLSVLSSSISCCLHVTVLRASLSTYVGACLLSRQQTQGFTTHHNHHLFSVVVVLVFFCSRSALLSPQSIGVLSRYCPGSCFSHSVSRAILIAVSSPCQHCPLSLVDSNPRAMTQPSVH